MLLGQYTGYSFTDTKKRGDSAYRWQGQTDAMGNPLDPFVDIESDKITFKTVKSDENSDQLSYELQVVGVMLEDYKKGYITSQGVLMDLDLVKKLEKEYMRANGIKDANYGKQGYSELYVKVDDVDNVEAVEAAIKEYGYETYSMSSERKNMQEQSQMIQLILGGLGAVSLFVAALSIANTMTMAIYERTREIGVMKVLGCKLSKIREMFLLEAGMIGFVGGPDRHRGELSALLCAQLLRPDASDSGDDAADVRLQDVGDPGLAGAARAPLLDRDRGGVRHHAGKPRGQDLGAGGHPARVIPPRALFRTDPALDVGCRPDSARGGGCQGGRGRCDAGNSFGKPRISGAFCVAGTQNKGAVCAAIFWREQKNKKRRAPPAPFPHKGGTGAGALFSSHDFSLLERGKWPTVGGKCRSYLSRPREKAAVSGSQPPAAGPARRPARGSRSHRAAPVPRPAARRSRRRSGRSP